MLTGAPVISSMESLPGMSGSARQRLLNHNGDFGCLRPWLGKDGRNYITLQNGVGSDGKPSYKNYVTNAATTLRREDWLYLDEIVLREAQRRLVLFRDVYSANPYNVPRGLGTIAIQHTIMHAEASATIAMDPIRRSERSRPTYETRQIPVPVIFSDGSFSWRELLVSRNSGTPLDTVGIETASRKVAEEVEKLTLGVSDSYNYGEGTIYGLLNFPFRNTKLITHPLTSGWTGRKLIQEILEMIQSLEDKFYYGPYVLYVSGDWGQYLDDDYNVNYGGETLRTRLSKIDKISSVRTLDFLTGYRMILIQLTSDVIQGVQALGMTTIQWEEEGGLEERFKVMASQFPRVRNDARGNTGYIEATATLGGTTTTTTTPAPTTTSTTTTTTTTT